MDRRNFLQYIFDVSIGFSLLSEFSFETGINRVYKNEENENDNYWCTMSFVSRNIEGLSDEQLDSLIDRRIGNAKQLIKAMLRDKNSKKESVREKVG